MTEQHAPTGKRLFLREGFCANEATPKNSNIVGWFNNKHNLGVGWTLNTLEQFEIDWLNSFKIDLNGVFRASSDKGTSIVKINFDTGTVAWMNADLEPPTFGKATKYRKAILSTRFYFTQ